MSVHIGHRNCPTLSARGDKTQSLRGSDSIAGKSFRNAIRTTEKHVPDPLEHAHNRGIIESILRHIPGFKGYLEQGYRRESDRLQREWLADRLQRTKQGINDYALAQTNAGQLDGLSTVEQLRSRLDRLINRLKGSISGYSGFFDFVQVKTEDLDDVYAHDHAMIQDTESLATGLENLAGTTAPPAAVVPDLLTRIADLESKVDKREDMLRGLEA